MPNKFSLAFISKMSRREKMILGVTAFFIGMVVADRFVIHPIISTFRSMNTELAELETNIKKSVRLLTQKERIQAEIRQYASYSLEAKSAEEEAVALLRYIEDLANKSAVNLVYVKPGAGKEEEANKNFVNLEFEAQMPQLFNFFYQVENSEQLLKVEKFALQLLSKGSSIVKCAVTISKTVIR